MFEGLGVPTVTVTTSFTGRHPISTIQEYEPRDLDLVDILYPIPVVLMLTVGEAVNTQHAGGILPAVLAVVTSLACLEDFPTNI